MIICCSRCAQVAPLGGGPRDTTPPKLAEANPKNVSTNFTSKTVELKFDEFVQLKDIANQLVITPRVKEAPLIEARGKRIIIKFNEDLKPNTTYRLFFGNAIADMHEGNVLPNFDYVFSTGNFIDSLEVSGSIINAFDLSNQKDVTVGLYEKGESDSAIYKNKPSYFTKTLDNGSYKLNYLPQGSFKAFAFLDNNKNLMYDGGEEMVGFKDTIIETTKDTIVNFRIFKEESPKRYLKKVISPYYGLAHIVYNKEVYNKTEALNKQQGQYLNSKAEKNDTATVYFYDVFDTLKVRVSHNEREADTINIVLPSKERFEKQKKERKFGMMVDIVKQSGKVPYFEEPLLKFDSWIDTASIDKTKISLSSKEDSAVSKDPVFKYAGVNSLKITTKLQKDVSYSLLLQKDALKNKSGIGNDSLQLSFKISSEDDYATLIATLLFPAKEKYIVQLLSDKHIVVAEQYIELSLTSSNEQLLTFKNILPATYFIKVIEDKNQNKAWDTGNLIQKKHAETIFFNSQPVKLPAGWDTEVEWKIN